MRCRRVIEPVKANSTITSRLPDFVESMKAKLIKFQKVMSSIAALDFRDAAIDGEIVALDEKGAL
jgi:hypothetical protein